MKWKWKMWENCCCFSWEDENFLFWMWSNQCQMIIICEMWGKVRMSESICWHHKNMYNNVRRVASSRFLVHSHFTPLLFHQSSCPLAFRLLSFSLDEVVRVSTSVSEHVTASYLDRKSVDMILVRRPTLPSDWGRKSAVLCKKNPHYFFWDGNDDVRTFFTLSRNHRVALKDLNGRPSPLKLAANTSECSVTMTTSSQVQEWNQQVQTHRIRQHITMMEFSFFICTRRLGREGRKDETRECG